MKTTASDTGAAVATMKPVTMTIFGQSMTVQARTPPMKPATPMLKFSTAAAETNGTTTTTTMFSMPPTTTNLPPMSSTSSSSTNVSSTFAMPPVTQATTLKLIQEELDRIKPSFVWNQPDAGIISLPSFLFVGIYSYNEVNSWMSHFQIF
jgi:hypothetical protein